MNSNLSSIKETLIKSGIVNELEFLDDSLETPWFVKVLLAFSAWIAAIFLIGFIATGFSFIIDSKTVSIITGSLMVVLAYTILRCPRNDFLMHLALAMSFAGQALIVWSVFRITDFNGLMPWAVVMLLQIILALVMPSFIHRVFSSYFAAFSLSATLFYLGLPYVFSSMAMLIIAYFWLNEFKFQNKTKQYRAIGYGFVLALIQLKGSSLFNLGHSSWSSYRNSTELLIQPWMGEVLSCLVTLYVVWQLLQRYAMNNSTQNSSTQYIGAVLVGVIVLCVASLEANGITIGLLVLLLGFSGSNRILIGLGIVSLLFYISAYYYLLDITLLEKSQTLAALGIVLLLSRYCMLRFLPVTEDIQNES